MNDEDRDARSTPWKFATLEWVDWFNTRRLLEPIGDLPPAEYEAAYYQQAAAVEAAAVT